jgi:hypothetical protein
MMAKYMLYTVVVCMRQSDGAPAFHVCTPEVSQAQIDEGEHYGKAIQNARDEGYEGDAVAFDLHDPAASQLQRLAKLVRDVVSGELALEVLELSGAKIEGREDGDPRSERLWVCTSPQGDEMSHVCIAKADAAVMFATWSFACSQNDWLQEVSSGSTVDSYVEWLELKLREIRVALRAKKNEVEGVLARSGLALTVKERHEELE